MSLWSFFALASVSFQTGDKRMAGICMFSHLRVFIIESSLVHYFANIRALLHKFTISQPNDSKVYDHADTSFSLTQNP